MINKTRISFDFDSTLELNTVQEYAKELIERDFEVWICTSRMPSHKAPNKEWNDDLFKVAEELGIEDKHIIFTNLTLKSDMILNKGFLWHLDDDSIEVDFINSETHCIGVLRGKGNDWRTQCETIIINNERINAL